MGDTIYVITSGEYSDYCVDSVWTDKVEAERICALYNRGRLYSDYRIETYPLNEFGREDGRVGFIVKYDINIHGYNVDVNNVEIMEAIITSYTPRFRNVNTSNNIVTVEADTQEAALEALYDLVPRLYASKLRLEA